MYTIYKINFSDGRCYIGSTCQQPWKRRLWRYHDAIHCVDPYRDPERPWKLVYNSIDVLEQGDDCSQRYEREAFWIQQHDNAVNVAKNATVEGLNHSDETKKKISESLTGDKHPMYGKHHSDESKKKMSKAVIWNDMEFASQSALAEYLQCDQTAITHHLQSGKPLKGHVVRRV